MSTAATAASASHANAYEMLGTPRLRISTQIAQALLVTPPLNSTIDDLPHIVLFRAAPARPFGAVDDATRRGLLVCLALPPPPLLKSTYFVAIRHIRPAFVQTTST
ncbi:hypothetical protein CGMCC3_g14439 [Colletotrichum fructicola]|nr:uncharacterized protein CGMCC3_g14439 [Colletotrichum fructicola]KAE9569396.1 hypothetical protein CGMCC3_g14439 [Colletotrichum fructicola]